MGHADVCIPRDRAGLFFRAEGGGSAPFEQIQTENSPRLVEVIANWDHWDFANKDIMKIPVGERSQYIFSGDNHKGAGGRSLAFQVSGGEVRPRNQAMRIWKRIK